jgi:GxxExxY protein
MDKCTVDKIIELAIEIYSTLGCGYSERIYHNAMEVSLRLHNLSYETERIVPVAYLDHVIGNIRPDLIVNNEIIVELKAVSCINNTVRHQVDTYVNCTGIKNWLIINFQQSTNTNTLQYESNLK